MADHISNTVDPAWDVYIGGVGTVPKDDIHRIIYQRREEPDSITVQIDTTRTPYTVVEDRELTVTLEDNESSVTFEGKVDSVEDKDDRPIVAIDGREPESYTDDTSLVGEYRGDTIFGVVDDFVNSGPSQVRAINFDLAAHTDKATFVNRTNFGTIKVHHTRDDETGDVDIETIQQIETLGNDGTQVQLHWLDPFDDTYYRNTTQKDWTITVKGEDGDGNSVEGSIAAPNGFTAKNVYGEFTPKLALVNGTQRMRKLTGVETNIGSDYIGTGDIQIKAHVTNYVKTTYNWEPGQNTTVRDGLNAIRDQLTALDDRQWEYYVEPSSNDLIFQQVQQEKPTTKVFREGQDVIRPIAQRSLDNVANFVKVDGHRNVAAYAWAYDGNYHFSNNDPLEVDGDFPENDAVFAGNTPGGTDIDDIDLRETTIKSNAIGSDEQAVVVAEEAIKNRVRVSVSGTAKRTGVTDVDVGDQAEVVFPSRGIPSDRIENNLFDVKRVEYRLTPSDATTAVEFGTPRPNAQEIVQRILEQRVDTGFTPVRGTVDVARSDFTGTVVTSNGETFEDVTLVEI